MKKSILLGVLAAIVLSTSAFAGYVNGYTRKDGTYVQGHYRSNPNKTVKDNYNYKGNTNPYSGKTGANKYRNNPSSGYYNGGWK